MCLSRMGLKVPTRLGGHFHPRDRGPSGWVMVDGDQMGGPFFGQRISIAIQRGNADSLLGTFPVDIDADEFFDAL